MKKISRFICKWWLIALLSFKKWQINYEIIYSSKTTLIGSHYLTYDIHQMRHNWLVKCLFLDQCHIVHLIYLFDKNMYSLESCGILVAIWKLMVIIQWCNNVVVIQSQVSVITIIVRKMLVHVSFFLLQLFYTTKISLQNLALSEKKGSRTLESSTLVFHENFIRGYKFLSKISKIRRQFCGTK